MLALLRLQFQLFKLLCFAKDHWWEVSTRIELMVHLFINPDLKSCKNFTIYYQTLYMCLEKTYIKHTVWEPSVCYPLKLYTYILVLQDMRYIRFSWNLRLTHVLISVYFTKRPCNVHYYLLGQFQTVHRNMSGLLNLWKARRSRAFHIFNKSDIFLCTVWNWPNKCFISPRTFICVRTLCKISKFSRTTDK